jgi:hypothetical protein
LTVNPVRPSVGFIVGVAGAVVVGAGIGLGSLSVGIGAVVVLEEVGLSSILY